MAIRNPCDEQREESEIGPLQCPPGQVLSNGRCVPSWTIRAHTNVIPTIVLPPAQDPFAREVAIDTGQPPPPPSPPPAPPPENMDELIEEGAITEIPYVSATRDLTTINEENFYTINNNAFSRIEEAMFNHSSVWINQKDSEDPVVDEIDKFRLCLLNFWNFNGESENITVRPVGDSRLPEPNSIQLNQPSGHELLNYSLLTLQSEPRLNNASLAYLKMDINIDGYTLSENMPFKFYKPTFDRARRYFENETSPSHIMDMYMAGTNSSVWLEEGRQTFWQENPDKFSFLAGGNIEYNKRFFDYTFDAPAAFFESEMNNIIISPFDSADIAVNIRNQELHQDLESELEIPSVYQYYQSKQTERLINNNQQLEEVLPPGLIEFNQSSIANYEEFSNENEFMLKSVLKFPSTRVESLEEINKTIKGSLNNYCEISINTTQGGPINAALQRNKMDTLILQLLKPNIGSAENPDGYRLINAVKKKEKTFTKVLDDQFIAPEPENTVDVTVNDKAVQNIVDHIHVDIDKMLTYPNQSNIELFWPRDLEEYPLYYHGWDNERLTRLEELIRSEIFFDQMNQIIEDGKFERSYADLLYGRKAYAEVIGYKIEKHRIVQNEFGQEEEVKIQEILLMDNDSIERLEFLDTQIIPDRKYKYKVFTINFVIGTKYEYDEQSSGYSWRTDGQQTVGSDTRDGRLAINVRSGRSVSIIYAPFFEKIVSAADKPPIAPQVSFLPYQGIDNKYAILLQSGFGEILEKPITVLSTDENIIQEIYRTQNRRAGSEILYRSDSLPNEFELIRIEEEPETYRDFESPSATIITKQATGKTAFFVVDAEPNKYYYYTFRTYDDGGISNPTEVFRVRMVSYQNGIFMEVEAYEMYKKPKELDISFAKVIKISPNTEQKMINFERVFQALEAQQEGSESLVRNIRQDLGLEAQADTTEFQKTAPDLDVLKLGRKADNESVWGKRFKLRCTSKTTGKKVDINFTFTQNKIKLEPK